LTGASAVVEIVIGLGIPLILLAVGLFVGGTVERRHLRDLDQREQALANMWVTNLKSFPNGVDPSSLPPKLVTGEVALATDYLKSFLASLKNLFGGEVRSYLSLASRARREALCRMLESAREQGYNAVCNVRFGAADIAGASDQSNAEKQGMVVVAGMASGTAYVCTDAGKPAPSVKWIAVTGDDDLG
jgi:uncharacterized protein YbjQ (UPF0145 family)